MLTDRRDVVIGVDTHRDSHAFAVVEARSGALLLELPANRGGYRAALARVTRIAPCARAWALEDSGSYGAGLCRFLHRRGERVLEVERPRRSGSRGRLKSDPLDALAAARSLLSAGELAQPRADGDREALRVLLVSREGAIAVRRAGLNELRALLLTSPSSLRERLARLGPVRLLRRCCALRPDKVSDPELRANLLALRLCARRVEAATREAAALQREISLLLERMAPMLLEQPGVGPISAAAIIVSWSHPGRLKSEAAFARLAGAAPIPASSGQVIRHRLDRGGDRRLNRALHTIILQRSRNDPNTIAYITRRRSEGKSHREAIRCLKRYLARSLFRTLEATTAPA